MIHLVFSVRDVRSAFFGVPLIFPNETLACRAFTEVVNADPSSNFYAARPRDFELFHIASFDDESGRFDTLVSPVSYGLGDNYVRPVEA